MKKLPLTIDPSITGFEKVLRVYPIEAMRYVWTNADERAISRNVYNHVSKMLDGGKKISRAAMINFLNIMCDEGVFNCTEETCKGGTRRVYTPALDEEAYKRHIAKSVFDSLMKDFPDQTLEAIKDSLGPKATDIPGL